MERVDINHASTDEIARVMGSESLARSVVEYRQSVSHFMEVDDLKRVPGIGDEVFEAMRDKIMLEPAGEGAETEPNKIDINHATRQQLESLPDVGTRGAEAIINYRRSVGEFKNVDELDSVPGIEGKVLRALKPHVRI